MIFVFRKLAVVRPIFAQRAFVTQIFNEICHLSLNWLRYLLNAFERTLFDSYLIHKENVIKK